VGLRDPEAGASAKGESGESQVPGRPILEVEDLTVSFGAIRAVDGVSLAVFPGQVYAVVGESGCGKSTLAYSLLDIVPPPGAVTAGEVRYAGRCLQRMSRRALDRLRAAEVAIVFQAAMNSFNPVLTIGRQVEHELEAHRGIFASQREGREYFDHLIRLVRLSPEQVWSSYESRLSGGMKQRVAIAMALLLKPAVLVLDEPTTALDVLSQRLVIDILRDLHATLGVTIIFITHDLAVVAELADRVAVMYAGRLVEVGALDQIFYGDQRHPYVAALLRAIPSIAGDASLIRPIAGQVPNLAELPPGCRFEPRCPLAHAVCHQIDPPLLGDVAGHAVACHAVNASRAGEGARA
jgi:peptide/nickel transport system ATP-binding protein